jgi:hypothetical protein
MLKATLKLKRDINISKYNKVNSFMKRTSTGYKPKKSRVFTKEDVSRFLTEAPDENFLLMKVRITSVFFRNYSLYCQKLVLIMRIAGACRREEF